jgi:hypothetical protein
MLNEWQNQVVILLENCCDSLIRTLKYIYAIAEEDYYTVNAKDIFKVALHDITNTAALDNMGLHIQESMPKEFTGEYLKTFRSALLYAFAVRLPYLLTSNNVSKKEMIELYTYLENNGAKPLDLMFEEDFRYFYKRNKSGRPEPSFTIEWFRRWVYTFDSGLSAITNQNMFFFGCADAAFPLFYAALGERIKALK